MKTSLRSILENPTVELLQLEREYATEMRRTGSTHHDILRAIDDLLGLEEWTPVVLNTLNRLMLSNKL